MTSFAAIEFSPTKWSANTLDTLRYYATILANECSLNQGAERDSSHYIDDTYFSWKQDDYTIKLFWCDEPEKDEWLCIAIKCESDNAKNLTNDILNNLKPFLIEHNITIT